MFSASNLASDRVAPSETATDGADAEVGEEDSKPEETADASPMPPTKSKNKKNKNK